MLPDCFLHKSESNQHLLPQNISLLKSAQGRIQRRQNRDDHRIAQHIFRAAAIGWDAAAMELQIHKILICAHIGANHADIPVTAAGLHQLYDPLRSHLHFLKCAVCANCLQIRDISGNIALEQCAANIQKRITASRYTFDPHLNTGGFCAPNQGSCCFCCPWW